MGSRDPPQDGVTERHDAPVRLLQWADGLLPADRVDWGQKMLGELDRIEERSKRWRFALGCVACVVPPPPWEAVGPMAALEAVALGRAVVFLSGSSTSGWPPTPGTG